MTEESPWRTERLDQASEQSRHAERQDRESPDELRPAVGRRDGTRVLAREPRYRQDENAGGRAEPADGDDNVRGERKLPETGCHRRVLLFAVSERVGQACEAERSGYDALQSGVRHNPHDTIEDLGPPVVE